MTGLPKRLVGLWALCFFLLSWSVEAAGVHACPHHTRIAPDAAQDVAAHDHHADPAPATPAHPGEHGGCTCESGCPSVGGASLPPAAELSVADGVSPLADVVVATTDAPQPHSFAHFLPFGLAPPLG